MQALELARYRVDPTKAEQLRSRWPAGVAAVRARFPGLLVAALVRLDERTWMDVWRWETLEAAKAAADGAASLPEAAAMFALIDEVISMEHAQVVERWSR